MSIRKAIGKDARPINEIISKEFPYKKFTEEIVEKRIERPDILILKKMLNQELAGFVDIELSEDSALINAVSVKPEFRRKGFAMELMKEAIKELEDAGVVNVRLLVKKENIQAKKLYAALGFEYTGKHHSKIEGSEVEIWENTIAYEDGWLN